MYKRQASPFLTSLIWTASTLLPKPVVPASSPSLAQAIQQMCIRDSRYTVWYRVHSAEFGWLGWACDGADAGSAGYGRAVQAVQVAVLPKGCLLYTSRCV